MARRLFEQGLKGVSTALQSLDQAEDELRAGRVHHLPLPTMPVTDHRRAHKSGQPRKIDSDPELQAFIRARLDRQTFQDIATEVAATFPKPRRVGKSAIHAWWTLNKP